MSRSTRVPGRRGQPWTKSHTPSKAYPGREAHRAAVRARLKAAVDDQADAAALVQTVRDCHEANIAVPAWAIDALDGWLTEFVNLATRKRGGRWTRWARGWPQRYLDAVIAAHLVAGRDHYGLTWAEAYDEAADWFRGTPAAGSPDKMHKAYKRDKKRGPLRPFTTWELRVGDGTELGSRPYKPDRPDGWFSQNSDRMGDTHGIWMTRPRLLWRNVGTRSTRIRTHT
jgi:hypothetical protein